MRNRLRSGSIIAGGVGLGLVGLLLGCSTASEESDGKRAPKMPPPQGLVKVADTWRAEVQLDGVSIDALTAAELNSVKPDFADSERRGWRVETLLPRAANATVVIADGAPGVSVLYEVKDAAKSPANGSAAEGAALRPAIFVTRRGEVSVAAVDPENPFPRYHGKGGQLRRIGDSQPRLLGVTRLRIFHGKASL